MCTVSYIPLSDGFILTSNRDENPERATDAPSRLILPGGNKVVGPRDAVKGGTWIAMDQKGRASCLLNGAFGNHKRREPYRRSRGHLVFESLDANGFESFTGNVALEGVEPFTLLMIERGSILKLVWDGGRKLWWTEPANTPHLWSSPTLYTPEQHAEKERFFKDALTQLSWEADEILQIHGLEGETPFILNRKGVCTVSISQIQFTGDGGTLQYHLKSQFNEKNSMVSSLSI